MVRFNAAWSCRPTVAFTFILLFSVLVVVKYMSNMTSSSQSLSTESEPKHTPGPGIMMQYQIRSEWDGVDNGHVPITIRLTSEGEGLLVNISAPFFNDPPKPPGDPGKSFQGLWDYEVVELFFLNDHEEYLEVELCPHGQHLVLQLRGRRKMIKDMLPLNFSSKIEGRKWKGSAFIPPSYFPASVNKFNAYAIHGSEGGRTYEALFPVPTAKFDTPDFHRLEYFKPIRFAKLLPENKKKTPGEFGLMVK